MTVDVVTDLVIRRPIEDVASFAADPGNACAWYANITSAEWQTPPPLARGSRVAFSARFLGRRLTYVYEVADFEPLVRLVMRTVDGPLVMQTLAILVVAAGLLAPQRLNAESTAPTQDGVIWVVDSALGVRFANPDSLRRGRFVTQPLPAASLAAGLHDPLAAAIVLVQPALLGGRNPDSIPAGGSVPLLWVTRPISAEATFRILRPDSTFRRGVLEVWRFPGYPVPARSRCILLSGATAVGTLHRAGGPPRPIDVEGQGIHRDREPRSFAPCANRGDSALVAAATSLTVTARRFPRRSPPDGLQGTA